MNKTGPARFILTQLRCLCLPLLIRQNQQKQEKMTTKEQKLYNAYFMHHLILQGHIC